MPQDEIKAVFYKQKAKAQELREGTIKERQQKVRRIKNWIFANRVLFHEALKLDLGKPAPEADVTEIFTVLTEAKHILARLKNWTSLQPVEGSIAYLGTQAYIQYEPKGTSLVIAPWNYPVLLSLGPTLSSIASGNTVILKPSEFTPNTNRVIGQMLNELFDESEITMIEGESDVATQLFCLPFDHVFFTGSPQVGKIVMTAAAKHLTSVTLELGGKSPCIVSESARLADASQRIAWGKWTNAGQTCVAPDYLFIHQSKAEQFKSLLKKEAVAVFGAEGDYSAIINERHFDRIHNLYNDAIDKGAGLVFGSDFDRNRKKISPTLIENTSDEMTIMKEEVFGPVLTMMVYENLQEVIDYINVREKPLALYYYGTNKKEQQKVAKATSSGALVFNDSVLQFGHPHLPMGGVNSSGIGKSHGKAGFLAFSHGKAVLKQRNGFTFISMIYPPYTGIKKKVIELMLKLF